MCTRQHRQLFATADTAQSEKRSNTDHRICILWRCVSTAQFECNDTNRRGSTYAQTD